MMGDDIRLRGIYQTRRVNPASREDRQDDKERFRKKLAELREDAEENSRAHRHQRSASRPPHDDEPPPRRDTNGKTGLHLDLRT